MGERGPKPKLDQLSDDDKERFARLWPDKTLDIKTVAGKFGIKPRTAQRWAEELGIERGGRAFGQMPPKRKRRAFAGQDARASERSTVEGAWLVTGHVEEDSPALRPDEVAREAFDRAHAATASFDGAWVLTDEGEFVEAHGPDSVCDDSPEMRAVTRRVERQRGRALGAARQAAREAAERGEKP